MMVPWYDGAEWEKNPHFVGQVKRLAGANFDKRPIVLICRSGNRTVEAGEALERAGFRHVVNVLHGFEGELDEKPPSQLPQRLARRRPAVGAVLSGEACRPAALAWLVWGLGAALYLVAFYQRVAPAVITRELSREFGLSAAALGNLSAFYFYSYVAVQIPTGLARRPLGAAPAAGARARRSPPSGTLLFALGALRGVGEPRAAADRRRGGRRVRLDAQAREPLDAGAPFRVRERRGALHRRAGRDARRRAAARSRSMPSAGAR